MSTCCPDPTPTAAEAAEATGCELGQIVKSLVFIVGESPTMVRVPVAPGHANSPQAASADEARAATGFAIGGIPPPRPRGGAADDRRRVRP